ncbi:tetratricopeptide repeat protein [Jeongeupia naejangsanensis]|uniref:Tetratricopeptide repeat protein n=1 Tax=Jeongeupia naejangsanensis TaxID=613195 RepID=A0ABS2BQM6_9NEIS|nr:tetratricopeptide repeat protein [Jeongeupia naejangsanensis]MBM3117903.1 tetratricopeptide repeat protein [Jeongeupia naejangsanensis]
MIDLRPLLNRVRRIIASQTVEAIAQAAQARELARQQAQPLAEAEALLLHGQAMLMFGRFEKGRTALMASLEIGRGVELGTLHGEVLHQIARSYYAQGNYDQTADCWVACLDLPPDQADGDVRCLAHIGLGQLLYAQEQFEAALAHHRHAVELTTNPDLALYRAAALINVAADLLQLERFDEAEAALDEALPLIRLNPHAEHEAEVYGLRAQITLARGDIERAQRHLRVALKLSRLNSNGWGEAFNLITLGRCSIAAGNFDHARDELSQALTLAEAMGTASLAARAHEVLAELFQRLGQAADAQTHLDRFSKLREQLLGQLSASRFATMELRLVD